MQASRNESDVVLVVEDDAVQCAEIADYLRRKGYEVATAADAYEALATLAETQPRVLVADINMPNLDGIRMAEVASNLDHNISVIFISGDERALQRAEWEDTSAVATLPKPIPLHQLEAMIRAIVGT
ncbi:MAG TPA: response regulator [Alphaproteobacteria bacterium]|nr:response regulator [Alphaproteobacteria bacterium]